MSAEDLLPEPVSRQPHPPQAVPRDFEGLKNLLIAEQERLPKRLPRAIAYEMALTGRRMGAAEAAGWGLVNHVVPASGLMAAARELAAQIAAHAPLALRAAKAVMQAGEGRSVAETYAFMRAGHIPVYNQMLRSKDAEEGPRAFGEKRSPVWRGE